MANETRISLTFGQLCEAVEAARQSSPYRAPEDVAGEWLDANAIAPEHTDAAERAAQRWFERNRLLFMDMSSVTFERNLKAAAARVAVAAVPAMGPRFPALFLAEIDRLLAAGESEVTG